jgi:predicted ester cyclase
MADNKSVVKNFQRDIDTGNPSILDNYIGGSYEDHNPPPFASKTPGVAGQKETFNMALGMFSDFRHVVEDQVAEGDKVATRITGSGKHVGPFLGIPPTNKVVTMSGIAIHRMAGGRLAEHWGQIDALGLLAQMGAIPAPARPPALTRQASERRATDVVMKPDRMKEALRRLFDEGMNGRKRAVFDELIDSTFVNYSLPMTAPGPQGFGQLVDSFVQAFPDMRVFVEDILAEDDKAASRGYLTGTQNGTFLNVPPTGKPVRIGYIDIWRAQNGRFVENWVQLDLLGALVQIGAVPAPGA